MDKLAFLDGETPVEPAVEPTPAVTPEPAAEPQPEASGQPRGPDGKFAPKTEAAPVASAVAPEPAVTPEPAPQAQPEPKPAPEGYVPLSAFTKLREEFNSYKQQNTTPAAPPPDPNEDFEGHLAWRDMREASTRAEWSERLAAKEHGAETVEAVKAWAQSRAEADPIFRQQAWVHPDPFGFAVEQWKRDQVFSKLSDPSLLDKFLALASGQQAAPAQPAVQVAPPSQPSPPPRSLAAVPNAGGARPGAQPVGPGVAFDNVFKD